VCIDQNGKTCLFLIVFSEIFLSLLNSEEESKLIGHHDFIPYFCKGFVWQDDTNALLNVLNFLRYGYLSPFFNEIQRH
jgi:hypothetical protein